MRSFNLSLVALAAVLAITGCGGSKSSSSDSSSDQSAAATSAPAGTSAGQAVSEIPSYPGADTQASGSGSNMGTSAAGKVMSTGDSFDKVYAWYQQKMPAGSEKSLIIFQYSVSLSWAAASPRRKRSPPARTKSLKEIPSEAASLLRHRSLVFWSSKVCARGCRP